MSSNWSRGIALSSSGCCARRSTVSRSSGLKRRQQPTKRSTAVPRHSSGRSMKDRSPVATRNMCSAHGNLKTVRDWTTSRRTIPRDHTSTAEPQRRPAMISGASQYADPAMDTDAVFSSRMDSPKSTSLMSPLTETITFAAFRSRYTILRLWMYDSTDTSCFTMNPIAGSFNATFFDSILREHPSTNSVTSHSSRPMSSSISYAARRRMMLGWSNRDRMYTSL
mmetsp:Transcript_50963/g.127918  ORF Transcript_50963/g.127918 Transcript_50963/m.127918 type:complete len:223 (-) Transcript_50963:1122-1790(-)